MALRAGTLPSAWGTSFAFPDLGKLVLSNLLLSGTLPQSWGSDNSLPALVILQLGSPGPEPNVVLFGDCQLEGTLPAQWGSPSAFQQLEILYIEGCLITGIVTFWPAALVHMPVAGSMCSCARQGPSFLS